MTGPDPVTTAVADLNSDGIPDLITGDFEDGSVRVFLGRGDGTFADGVVYAAPGVPTYLFAADINGDHRTDIIVATARNGSGTSGVAIFLGNGDGTLNPGFMTWEGGAGAVWGPPSIVPLERNGHGFPDLAVLDHMGKTVVILSNWGNGTFAESARYDVSAVGDPSSIATGDFNGDGRPDLAVAGEGVGILLGGPGPSFAPPSIYPTNGYGVDIQVSDLNGDGHPDVAVVDQFNDRISILLGFGDGTFQLPTPIPVGESPRSLTIADFNHDGFQDLIVSDVEVGVVLGNGNGTFRPEVEVDTGYFQVPSSTVVSDFNGDGAPDFAVTNVGHGIDVHLSDAQAMTRLGKVEPIGGGALSTAMADFNEDGLPDLVVANAADGGRLTMLRGTGHGGFGAAFDLATGSNPESVISADFNGDGHADVAATTADGHVLVLLGDGTGHFGNAIEAQGVGFSGFGFLTAADFNGDGHLDIAVTGTTDEGGLHGLLGILFGKGDGSFSAPVPVVQDAMTYLASGDFNGDGRPDLIVSSYSGLGLRVLIGNGDGTFQSPTVYPLADGPGVIALSDFNSDGNLDVAVLDASSAGGGVSVLLGHGDGTFAPPAHFMVRDAYSGLGVGDFNGDGAIDLAVGNWDGVSIMLGDGTGTFAPAVTYPVGDVQGFLVTGDFNGDGRSDIAGCSAKGIRTFLNTGCMPQRP